MKEIERKFLTTSDEWRRGARGVRYRQGYLSTDKGATVRVRTMGTKAALTIKGVARGISRDEFEYAVPLADAVALLKLCDGRVVDKIRHRVRHAGKVWEVDEFLGRHRGLVVAELELSRASEAFVRPPWLGREVSLDRRYANSALATARVTPVARSARAGRTARQAGRRASRRSTR